MRYRYRVGGPQPQACFQTFLFEELNNNIFLPLKIWRGQDGQTYVDQVLKFWTEQDFTTISQMIRQENGDDMICLP